MGPRGTDSPLFVFLWQPFLAPKFSFLGREKFHEKQTRFTFCRPTLNSG